MSLYHDNKNSKLVEDDPELYCIDNVKFKESVNGVLKDTEVWLKCTFGIELKNFYGMNNIHNMNGIYDNDVNNISEHNLLYDILNSYKGVKAIYYYYYPILYGCINKCRDK